MDGKPPNKVDLESVIVTAKLNQRPFRAPDFQAENAVIVSLVEEMAKSPGDIFHKLVEAILKLCDAQSASISLLDKKHKKFYWPAIAGQWKPYIGGGTPHDFGPCSTVLDAILRCCFHIRNAILVICRQQVLPSKSVY